MALTVHLTRTADPREITHGVPTLVFESDGVSALFEPTFVELGDATGKYVDPYAGAPFAGAAELEALKRVFAAAGATLDQQPAVIRVVIGIEPGDPPREHVEHVERAVAQQLVAGILDFVDQAQRQGLCVYFYGD